MSVRVIGSINIDWVARVRELPRPGETVMATALSRHVGGKGANQAVAAAQAGSATRLSARVGRDDGATWVLEFLRSAGVDIEVVTRDPDAPTGQAFITVADGGENAIVVVAGANQRLAADDARFAPTADERVLLAQFETSFDPLLAQFAASDTGRLRVLNAAPALLERSVLFEHCDVILVNETELACYARTSEVADSTAEVAAAARSLICRPQQTIIVTLGARGAVVVRARTATRIAGRSVRVVDTVGAGDCFCGVFAASLDQGLAVDAAAERANRAASIAVGRCGAAEAMPDRAEIDAIPATTPA